MSGNVSRRRSRLASLAAVTSADDYKAAMLRDARNAFPQFYRSATPEDERTMDAVVLGHAAMVVLLNTPRDHVTDQARRPLDRASDGVDQLFAASREALRSCPTYHATGQFERDAIESILLTVLPPK